MDLVDDDARALSLRREIEELDSKKIESQAAGAGPDGGADMVVDAAGDGATALGKRRRLQSTVAVTATAEKRGEDGSSGGEAAGSPGQGPRSFRPGALHSQEGEEDAPLPRPLASADPKTKRRNRKIFGALLLGTLERFREEDQRQQDSEAFARRSMLLRKAEQKAAEEREALRQKERERQIEERRRDLVLRARLVAKAEEKEAQLLLLHWKKHHASCAQFLRTRSYPPVYFRPAMESVETEHLKELQLQDFESWLSARTEELRASAEENLQRHLDTVNAQLHPLLTSVAPTPHSHAPQGGPCVLAHGGGTDGGAGHASDDRHENDDRRKPLADLQGVHSDPGICTQQMGLQSPESDAAGIRRQDENKELEEREEEAKGAEGRSDAEPAQEHAHTWNGYPEAYQDDA